MTRVMVVVVIGLLAADAHAFLCTRAGVDGPSLAWEPRTIPMHVSGGGAEVSAQELGRVLGESMLPWNGVDCSDIGLLVAEPTEERLAGFDWAEGSEGDNENIVVFRNDDPDDPVDAWLHQLGALAITTVTFESNAGELLDADVEINDVAFPFTTCDPEDNGCDVEFDLQNTLTHELGHVLGLDHTQDADATMFASAPRSDTSKRTLAGDDIDAICLVYPSGGPVGECFQVERQEPPDVRFTPTVCGQLPSVTPLIALAGVLLLCRRSGTRRPRR